MARVWSLMAASVALLGPAGESTARIVFDPWYLPPADCVSLTHRSSNGEEWIDVAVVLPTPCHYAGTWGSATRSGSNIRADAAFYSPPVICVQILATVCHSYSLGTFPDGTYQFTFSAFWQPLRTIAFVVGPGAPYIPGPELVQLHHRAIGSNEVVEASVALLDSCKRVLNWGTASRNGSTFATDATLRDTGGACAQVVTTVSNVFDLGPLSHGIYEFVFRANGRPVNTNEFTVPDSETDSDGDGASDWHEYLADTDPRNPHSKLCVTRIKLQEGRLHLEWQGGVTVKQVLQQATGWDSNGLVWRDVLTNVPPTSQTISCTNLTCSDGMSFFRIRVVR